MNPLRIKGRFTGTPVLRGALQTTLIGGLAAAAVSALPGGFRELTRD